MSFIFFYPRIRPLDDDGNPMPGCYLQFYESETTTPTPVYADGDLETELPNPVVSNAAGIFPAIYGDPSVVYRMQLYTADDVLISDDDPIHPHAAFPPGTLMMFDGTEEDRDDAYPPALWELCDGDNDTPDTRDRSPVGVSNTKAIGTTGGDASGTTSAEGAHDHTGDTGSVVLDADNMPVHGHRLYVWDTGGTDGAPRGYTAASNIAVVGSDEAGGGYREQTVGGTDIIEEAGTADPEGHAHTITEEADHTHTVDTQSPYFTTWFLKRKAS